MSERPQRSSRLPARYTQETSLIGTSRLKRKAPDANPGDRLEFLLKNPRSSLATIDISDLINLSSWDMLSLESQDFLKTLLPPTAFRGFQPSIESHHPSVVHWLDINHTNGTTPSSDPLDTSVFTDPHFLAAVHTIQDHIYSNWMSDTHIERVRIFQEGVRDGTLSAAWKDEVWESNNATCQPDMDDRQPAFSIKGSESFARAGEAAETKLTTLARHGVLRLGDVLAYRRNFSSLGLVVEKDVIVQSIHPRTCVPTVLLEPGTSQYLPAGLLLPKSSDPSAGMQAMDVTSPTMLETGLLDTDARVERSKRPNGNAWKCFTVWRWRGEVPDLTSDNGRGGRENHGTLFYLRGSHYHDI